MSTTGWLYPAIKPIGLQSKSHLGNPSHMGTFTIVSPHVVSIPRHKAVIDMIIWAECGRSCYWHDPRALERGLQHARVRKT